MALQSAALIWRFILDWSPTTIGSRLQVKMQKQRVHLTSQSKTAIFIPAVRFTVRTVIRGESVQIVRRVYKLESAPSDKVGCRSRNEGIGPTKVARRRNRKLASSKVLHRCPADLLPSNIVECKRI